jgi:hypothetical protein
VLCSPPSILGLGLGGVRRTAPIRMPNGQHFPPLIKYTLGIDVNALPPLGTPVASARPGTWTCALGSLGSQFAGGARQPSGTRESNEGWACWAGWSVKRGGAFVPPASHPSVPCACASRCRCMRRRLQADKHPRYKVSMPHAEA